MSMRKKLIFVCKVVTSANKGRLRIVQFAAQLAHWIANMKLLMVMLMRLIAIKKDQY